jgi:predicted secreted protein
MTSSGEIGYGLVLAYSNDNITYTPVAQVVDVKGPGIKVTAAEISNNDSPSGAKEFVPGMSDFGDITFNCIYKAAIMTALRSLLRLTKYWRITYADTHTEVGQGFITALEKAAPLDKEETLDMTVKGTGAFTFT